MPQQRARRGKRISEAEFRRLWEDRTLTVEQIGKMLDISARAVWSRAMVRGLAPRGLDKPTMQSFTGRRIEAFRALWAAGVKQQDIADAFGVSFQTIRRTAARLGLAPRGRARCKQAITLDEWKQIAMRDALARSARIEQDAIILSEMADYLPGGGRRPIGQGVRA